MSEDVSRHLDELHEHLEGVDEQDHPEAADLKAAVAAYDAAAAEEHEGFLDHLRDSALRFETSHPAVSNAIARVIDSLTAAGL